MRKVNLVISVTILAIITSCSGSKNITNAEHQGEAAYLSGNYAEALTHWEKVIEYYNNQNKPGECPVYTQAAAAAMETGQTDKAIGFLEAETHTSRADDETYYNLALLYREIDNLSKELDALETYAAKFPDGKNIGSVRERLFDIYIETDNYDAALKEWELLTPATKSELTVLESYFEVNKKLKNDSVCDSIAMQLLETDKENIPALEWMGKKLFWQAEKLYQSELKAYNTNKTSKQYNKLLRSLDKVTAGFKSSLDYFNTLYAIDPEPEYAKYIGDIYNRLDDKQKAAYYYEKSKGND